MYDEISPQKLLPLKDSCVALFQDKPVVAFALYRLLVMIEDNWESGQMEQNRHEQLVPLVKRIKKILDESTIEDVDSLLHDAHQLMPSMIR